MTSTHRVALAKLIVGIAAVASFAGQSAVATDTGDIFLTTATDLSVGANYTTTITPTSATTTDVQFSGSYGTTTLTVNATALSFGTLNDLDTTQSLVITNTATNAAGSIKLNTASNSTSGSSASDLLYVASGANLTIQNGAGSSTTTLSLAAAGNVDNAGTLLISGPVTITGTHNISFTGAGTTNISGSITASGGTITVSAGTLTLSGANTYSDATTVSAGTLSLTGSLSGSITSTSGVGIVSESSAGSIGGTGTTFTQASGGTTVLGGANTYTGATTVSAGTLSLTGSLAGSNVSTSGAGIISESSVGAIGGSGITFTQAGSGTATLGGANTYTGATTVNGGTLSVTGSLNSTSALVVGGGAFSYAPTANSGSGNTQTMSGFTVNAGGSTINASSGNTLALGALTARSSGGAVNFNSATTGAITTSAANANNILGPWATYGSGTSLAYATVSGGSIGAYTSYTGAGDSAITTPASITATNGTTNYTLSGATSATAGASASIDTLRYTGSGLTITPTISLTLNGLMNAGTGALAVASNPITIGAGAGNYANELVITGNTQPIAISSAIQNNGSNASSLTYSGAGALTLSGTNIYTGGTTIDAGTVEFTLTAAMPSAGTVTAENGGTLAVAVGGAGQFTNATSGAGSLGGIFSTVGTGSAVVTLDSGSVVGIDTGSGNVSYAGSITNAGVGITKLGSGTLTLSGASYTYTGPTAISAGVLALAQPSGAETLYAAAAGGGFVGNLVIETAIRVNFDNGVFSGGGNIQVQTTGTILNNSNAAPGPGTVSNSVSLNSTGISFTKGNVAAGTYTPGTFVTSLGGTSSSNSNSPITFSGIISGNSDLNFANNATTGGGGGPVALGSSSAPGGSAGYETYAGTTTVNNNGVITFANSNVLPTGTDVIVGTETGIGTPTFNLNGFNQQIGSLSDGANVTATAHNLTITNNATGAPATLTIGDSTTPANGSSAIIADGTSTVALVKTGTDTITLKGNHNAFSGGVTVNQGALTATGAGALGTGAVTVNPTGTSGTAADAATLTTNTSAIGNSGSAFTVNTNSATAIGTINFTSGSPTIGSLSGNGSAVLQSSTGTNLTIGSSANNLSSTFSGAISEATVGEGSITKAGIGVLALSGINTYTGATTVTAGTLVVDGSISGSATTVQTGGALGGSGTVGSLSLQSGGTLAPGLEFSGESIKTLTGAGLTWNGGGTMNFELSASSNASDLLLLSSSLGTGALTEGTAGTFQFNFLGGGEAGQTYDLVNFSSTNFSASAFSATNLGSGLSANFELSGSELQVQLQSVPEPSAWGALVWGVGILIGFRRFRQPGDRRVEARRAITVSSL